MFKYLPCLGGSTSRCRFTTLLLMAFVAISFSSVAQAQHGVSIVKGCTSPVRICDTDADCDDDNACTIDTCNLDIPDMLNCQFAVISNDTFNDTLMINGAWDIIFNNGGPTRVPAVGDSDILSADGNTTCVVGPFVPCTIGPDIGGGEGSVTFVSTGYSPTPDDPSPLQDQVTILVEDLCDGDPDPSCSPNIDNPVSFGAATITVPGCLPPEDVVCPPDDDLCTEDFECDPATGECPQPGPPLVCPPDDDCCTEDFECDPATGLCPPPGPPQLCPPDDDLCTEDFDCDCFTGLCPPPGPPLVCPPDDNLCTEDFECDPATGECPPPGPPLVCPPDDDLCTEDFECDPATGLCPDPGPPLVCPPNADGVICDLCDPATGECIAESPVPDRCLAGMEICRTPGFWGARGGIEKAPRSQNITQAVIDQAILENGLGLPVCGIYIDNTDLLSNTSAIEAMCVSVKGVTKRQLVRQLTAAALNCVLGDCSLEHATLVADCNVVCDTGVGDMQACIGALDTFNNGGDGGGVCAIGGEPCDDVNTCVGSGDFCLPDESCHDRNLCPDFEDDGAINGSDFCFDPPGPASSPRKCNAARKNDVYVP